MDTERWVLFGQWKIVLKNKMPGIFLAFLQGGVGKNKLHSIEGRVRLNTSVCICVYIHSICIYIYIYTHV